MTNRQNGILAAVFCAAGCLCAGVAGYELDRTYSTASTPRLTLPGVDRSPTAVEKAALPVVPPDTTVLPPVSIDARVAAALPAPTRASPRAHARCTAWRAVKKASAIEQVRLCQ